MKYLSEDTLLTVLVLTWLCAVGIGWAIARTFGDSCEEISTDFESAKERERL